MDFLFSPWRFAYVTDVDRQRQEAGCVLCTIGDAAASEDETALVVHRGEHHFVVLNRYPYTSGHLMVVPYTHVSRLRELTAEATAELARLATAAESALERAYRPQGINFGLNIGECAGAGIADHLHLHAVPRWTGDTNFMTVSGETRVIPEALEDSWRRLRPLFPAPGSP